MERWAQGLAEAINQGDEQGVVGRLNEIFGEVARGRVKTDLDPKWTIRLAKRRIRSAPLRVVKENGKHVADIWVQRQYLPDEGWREYKPLLAIKLDRESLPHDLRRLLEDRGIDYEWYPPVSLEGSEGLWRYRIHVLAMDFALRSDTVTVQMDPDGRYILEGEKGVVRQENREDEVGIFARGQVAMWEIYQDLGIVRRNRTDAFIMPIIERIERFFGVSLGELGEWVEEEERLPRRVRYRFLRGPWRRVGVADLSSARFEVAE